MRAEEFSERVLETLAPLVVDLDLVAVERWRDAFGFMMREWERLILDKARSAIQAEADYRAALHAKTGSRYGADRYQRNLEAAATRRDAVRKELGL